MPTPFKMTQTGPTTLHVTRGFAAPPALVWRAHTDPRIVLEWFGMPGYPIIEAEIDLKVGGGYRYEWQLPEGDIMGVSGSYLELEEPRKIVHTERFDEDWTDGETTVTIVFHAVEAGTRLEMDIAYRSEKGLKMALETGMDEGMDSTYTQLDAMLDKG